MAIPGLDNWKQALAQELGMPLSPGLSQYFDLWSRAEGGGAANNPFNTTQPGFGATGSYNSVGVKNYGDPMQGIKATAATLKNGRYGNILQAMRSGDPHAMAQALANSPWGTGALVLKMLGGGGSATPPPPPTGAPPLPGAPNVPQVPDMPSALDVLLQKAAPSALTQRMGQSMGGTFEKVAQAAAAPIPFVHAPQPMATPTQPNAVPPSGPANWSGPPGKFKGGDPVMNGTSVGGEHPTMGLDGFPAHDFFAPAGSEVAAPVTGRIIKLSGHDPRNGPTQGPHGPLGWSVYIQGNDGHVYFLTHMGSRDVTVGQKIKAGQPIGTVANYDKYGTPSHIHMGVH